MVVMRHRRWVSCSIVALLFALPAVPVGADVQPVSAFPVHLLTDRANDVETAVQDLAGLERTIDVRRLTVESDTEENLGISLVLEELEAAEPRPTTQAQQVHVGTAMYYVNFTLAGTNVSYSIYFFAFVYHDAARPGVLGVSLLWSTFCLRWGDGACRINSLDDVRIDPTGNAYRVTVRKSLLSGRSVEPALPVEASIRAGTDLTGFRVDTMTYGTESWMVGRPRARDSAEGGEQRYHIQTNGESSVLLLKIASGGSQLPLTANAVQSVPFSVANLMEAKRLIWLQYEVQGPPDLTKGFVVSGPKSLSLPAGQWRNYTLIITAPADIPEDNLVEVVVRATNPDTPDVGYAKASLFPSLRLEKDSNRLYVHTPRMGEGSAPWSQFFTAFCATRACNHGFLSGQAEDPRAAPGERVELFLSNSESTQSWTSWFPLGRPLLFEPDKPIVLKLKAGAYPTTIDDVTVQASLYYTQSAFSPDRVVIANFEASGRLPADGHEFTLTGRPRSELGSLVPPRVYVGLLVGVTSNDPHAQAQGYSHKVWVASKDSHLTLPLANLPEELLDPPVPSPFQFSLLSEREEFARPGHARLFTVSVTNIDSTDQRVRLVANASRPGWTVDVKPGTVFDLSPGASVTLGVLAHVPATAAEGERAEVIVNALADDGSRRLQRFLITATSNADDADDLNAFVADPDDLEKIPKQGNDTPAPLFATVLLCIAFVVLRRRRA